jgi:hypothetical protein
MLTNTQIRDLSKRMSIPLADTVFKTDLPRKFDFNKSYFINLDDEYNQDGTLNQGSHWTCLQINKYPNDLIEAIYFDPYGIGAPEEVKKVFNKTIGATGRQFPHNTKDVQSLMSNACGWYCLAFLHYINVFPKRTKNLYDDTDAFLSFFDDLNKQVDFKKNEYILKQFFQSADPKLRKDIDVYGDGISRILEENTQPIDLNNVSIRGGK